MDADKKRIKTEAGSSTQQECRSRVARGTHQEARRSVRRLGRDTGDIAGLKRRREIGLAAIGGYHIRPEFKSQCCRTSRRRRIRTSKCCSPNLCLWARCDRSCYRSVSISRTVVRVTVALVASSSIEKIPSPGRLSRGFGRRRRFRRRRQSIHDSLRLCGGALIFSFKFRIVGCVINLTLFSE